MSLRRSKTIYCVVMISAAVVLATTAGLLGWITAVLLLSGALPLFSAVRQAAEQRGVSDYRNLRRATARHILSSAQVEPDAREVGQ